MTCPRPRNTAALLSAAALLLLLLLPLQAWADYVRITGSVVNVRKGPGTSFPVLFQAEPPQAYPLLSREGHWCRIALADGSEAWVFRRLVAILPGDPPGEEKPAAASDPEPEAAEQEEGGGYLLPLVSFALLLLALSLLVWRRREVASRLDRGMQELAGYRREKPFRYDQRPPDKDRWEW